MFKRTDEKYDYLELLFDVFETAAEPPRQDSDKEKYLLDFLEQAKDFADRWKQAGLPRNRMVAGYRNELIRLCVLDGVHQHIHFSTEELDALDNSWRNRKNFKPSVW